MSIETKKSSNSNHTIQLTNLPLNQLAKVEHISAGRNATHRLSGLGITVGTSIRIISQAPFRGPIQIEVRNTRLAIGRGLAQKIMVSML